MDKENTACPHCARKTVRDEESKKSLLHRLNRIEGQIRGLKEMLASDAYCNDILTQSAAAGAALNAFNRRLIALHLSTCVATDLASGHNGVIEELTKTLERLMK